ncbi:hypothetical protein LCGC14_1007640 [marine sediment metagenome]|uniref:Lipoprotein n=1 Tax=marine sediment metagenome TaxID=412755 RepID=A0A0F9QJL5_9ZZZZ
MKSLKTFIILALFAFLVFGCVTTPEFNRKLNEPAGFKVGNHPSIDFYNQRSPWDSPFNPHEVLQYWEKIYTEPMSSRSLLIVVGNPKINWEESDKQNPGKLSIPEGEFASAVAFIFFALKDPKVPELAGYGYTDRSGRKQLFRWKEKKKKYARFRDPKEKVAEIY